MCTAERDPEVDLNILAEKREAYSKWGQDADAADRDTQRERERETDRQRERERERERELEREVLLTIKK